MSLFAPEKCPPGTLSVTIPHLLSRDEIITEANSNKDPTVPKKKRSGLKEASISHFVKSALATLRPFYLSNRHPNKAEKKET